MSEPAIEVRDVVKRFGRTEALRGVTFQAEPGTVLGLLGPNGAGKTTAIRVLTTLLRPDAGQAQVFGFDVATQGPAGPVGHRPGRAVRGRG
jgi:ABC-type multidrug transport system ATPase subunit